MMKQRKKTYVSLLLACLMLFTFAASALAASFPDTADHWAADAIDTWSSYGVVQGDETGFRPNDSLSRGEMAVLFSNLLGLQQTADNSFSDLDQNWYTKAMLQCVAAGIIQGDGATIRPNSPITRQEAVVMFARALNIPEAPAQQLDFSDGDQVSDWAAGYVTALTKAGIINGMGDGQFAPTGFINRAAAVTILNNAVTTYVNQPGSYEVKGDGITLVVAGDVVLTGTAAEDVLIAAGASGGNVELQVPKVTGALQVEAVDVAVTAKDAAIDQVVLAGSGGKLVLEGACAVDQVTVAKEATGAQVTVNGKTNVKTLTSEANQVTVSGTGTVEQASVSGNDTKVDTSGTKVTVAEGTTGATHNGKDVPGGTVSEGSTTPNPPSSSGGSGGGPSTSKWDGKTIDTSWYNGEKTSFTISKASQLAGLAAIVNGTAEGIQQDDFNGKTIRLSVNINLDQKEWTPIGVAVRSGGSLNSGKDEQGAPLPSKLFAGTFDGNNRIIRNLTIQQPDAGKTGVGLFSAVAGETAKVMNLKLEDVSIVGQDGFGAVCGYLASGATLENCEVKSGTVSGSGEGGGLTGKMLGSNGAADAAPAYLTKLVGCINRADVRSLKDKAGGMAGGANYANVNGELLVQDCKNFGNITGLYAGGLCGYTAFLTIEGSSNDGTITGTKVQEVAQTAGGLMGSSMQSAVLEGENSGAVSCVDGDAGGIAGYAQDTTGKRVFRNCVNSGAINGKNAGGIFGNFSVTTVGCTNTGAVEGTYTAGGIAGAINNWSIEKCTNTGAISGEGFVGGIAGNVTYAKINKCVNQGTVTATGDQVGGICGFLAMGAHGGHAKEDAAAVVDSQNFGMVQGATSVGGIVGQVNGTAYGLSACVNQGSVEGQEKVGGVIGYYNTGVPVTKGANAFVNGCSNSGAVTGGTAVGGFMGATELRTAGGDTIFTDCHTTATQVSGSGNVGVFVGVTQPLASSVAGTADEIFADCTYLPVDELPIIGNGGPGDGNIQSAQQNLE